MKSTSTKTDVLLSGAEVPCPDKARWKWLENAAKFVGEDPSARFGTQLARIASDMIIVCDEEMQIQFHNRAFLKGVGYQEGTFVKHSLFEFFPRVDRDAAETAFDSLRVGISAGLRINASVLTRRGTREFDIRAVRSRRKDASYLYYLVGRDDTRRVLEMRALRTSLVKANAPKVDAFDELPIAMWRTDRRLRIEAVHGGLWKEMGIGEYALKNASLADGIEPQLPSFFHEIDFCYAMAGRSVQKTVEFDSEHFEVSVEPILDEKGAVAGTLGFLRRSKHAEELEEFPTMNLENPRVISLEDEKSEYLDPEKAQPKRPTPRTMQPPEFYDPERDMSDEAEPVVLSR